MKLGAALPMLLACVAHGAQDSAYYPGFSNPNTEDDLYYREAVNVIQDVEAGEFDALYIKYHSCVWSEYGSGEDQSSAGESGCGGDGTTDAWYLGRTQCFRANVAYSLYGVKKGQSSDSPCSSSQYINSFFTTGGIESFGDNVGVDYTSYGVSTKCNATLNQANEDDNHQHNQLMYPEFTSTTLGCSASGDFISATFEGAFCGGNHFLSNDGEIADLNTDLQNLGCYQIYDSSTNTFAASLLEFSAACSHTEYPTRCPDPYGVKRSRDQKLFKYAQSHYRAVPLIMPIMSSILLLGTMILFCLANGVRDAAKRQALERESGEAGRRTIYETFSTSFHRAATDISSRTRTFTEKLAAYAEEEDDDVVMSEASYEAPPVEDEGAASTVKSVGSVVSTHSEKPASPEEVEEQTEDAQQTEQKEVADAMLAEKGVTPTSDKGLINEETGKRYKRPRLARLSKWIRGKFGRRKKKAASS